MKLARSLVLERLAYDPATGIFTKTKVSGGRLIGSIAGRLDSKSHRQLSINGQRVLAHRVAWFLVHGEWPSLEIDHINGNRNDNRIANLRQVTHAQNMQNQRRARSDNKSAILGVSHHNGKWRARIRINGRLKHLGTYTEADDAQRAYVRAKRQLHTHGSL